MEDGGRRKRKEQDQIDPADNTSDKEAAKVPEPALEPVAIEPAATAPAATPTPAPSLSSKKPGQYTVIEGITSPRNMYPKWDQIIIAVREAFIKQGGSTTEKDDPLKKDNDKFYILVDKVVSARPNLGVARGPQVAHLSKMLHEHMFSMGVIGRYLKVEGLEEIMLNGYSKMFIKVKGKKFRVESAFGSDAEALNYLQNMFGRLGDKPLNEEHSSQRGVLPDGSRIQAVIYPASTNGVNFSIRKHRDVLISVEEYLNWETFTQQFWDDVKIWIGMGMNILVSGGTGTGKTSFLNVLLDLIPPEVRVITIEDTPEIKHVRDDLVQLVGAAGTGEGEEGVITIKELVDSCLRLNPDRIVIGETRGAEAWDFLEALNTGHDGSMGTVHANSAQRALNRIATLAGRAFGAGADEQSIAIWESISNTMNIVIQLKRMEVGDQTYRFVSEAWQFGHPDMFDKSDPMVVERLRILREAGQIRNIRPNQLTGWPLYRQEPMRPGGTLKKISDIVPILGSQL